MDIHNIIGPYVFHHSTSSLFHCLWIELITRPHLDGKTTCEYLPIVSATENIIAIYNEYLYTHITTITCTYKSINVSNTGATYIF